MIKPKFKIGNKVIDIDDPSTVMKITKVGGDMYRAAISMNHAVDFDMEYECEWTTEKNNLISATFHQDRLELVAIV